MSDIFVTVDTNPIQVQACIQNPIDITASSVGVQGPPGSSSNNNDISISGLISTGQADIRYYPLSGNPSGYINRFGPIGSGNIIDSGIQLQFGITPNNYSGIFFINSAGNLLFNITNRFDIGSVAGNSPRNIYLVGTLTAGSLNATNFDTDAVGRKSWVTRSRMLSPSNGIITLYNAAQTDFTALQLGGTTSAFPEVKRSGVNVALRLADDSDFTSLLVKNITAIGNISSSGNILAPNLSNIVYTTGGQLIFGDKYFLDSQALESISVGNRTLSNATETPVLNWANNTLLSPSTFTVSLDWGSRGLSGNWLKNGSYILTAIDSGNLQAKIDSLSGYVNNSNVSNIVYTTGDQTIVGIKNFSDLVNIAEIGLFGDTKIDLNNGTLIDNDTIAPSLNWNAKWLLADNGAYPSLDWQNLILSGSWNLNGSPIINSGYLKDYHESTRIYKSSRINFINTGNYVIATIPSNTLFMVDSMEIISTHVNSPSAAPYVKFGNTNNYELYQIPTQTTSNSLYSRHVFDNAQDAIPGGTILTASISTGSTAVMHSGFLIFKGYLIQN